MVNYHEKVLQPFSADELNRIAQLKRFFEWVDGDPVFKKQVIKGKFPPEVLDRFKRIGLNFDIDELAILWKEPESAGKFLLDYRRGVRDDPAAELVSLVEKYPLFALWGRFVRHKNNTFRGYMADVFQIPFRIPKNQKFDAWRLRRIRAVRSELGYFGYLLDHPILAIELGDGCSVGCWFCAFASRKLTKNFDYTENRDFFRQITQTCVELFGKNQASMALLYYGTEPHDNPHYLDFVRDYSEITGHPVCTATAVPTDTKWLRELIAFYRKINSPWPRLSVLTKSMLLKIHELYSPEELRDVEFLMQMKSSGRRKVTAGRVLSEQRGLRDREPDHYLDGTVPQGSIACVTGFLVNMVNLTIQVVSPCFASKKWPYSYRVFDETTFTDADNFRHAIITLIDRNMYGDPPANMFVRFRDDLVYRPTDDGFRLVSPNQAHHFSGKMYIQLGELIESGAYTFTQTYTIMADKYRFNPISVVAVVKKCSIAVF